MVRTFALWLARIVVLLAIVLFATLVALFSAVTYLELTEGEAQSPVSILTAVLVPVCGAFAAGCWWLFVESFKRSGQGERAPDGR
jgi:formate hydrogenlyase subunit 3/multisubunit Na+/H+ antiporter MnhD subunit